MIHFVNPDANLEPFRGLIFERWADTRELFRANLLLLIYRSFVGEWVECNFGREWRYGRKEFFLLAEMMPWSWPKVRIVKQYRWTGEQ